MFQEFPYTNFHELNLDWIVKITKDFLDQYTHIQEVIQTGLEDLAESRETGLEELDQKRLDGLAELNQKTLDGLADLQAKYDTLDGLLQSWYDTHSEDIARQLADAIIDFNTAAEAKSQALLDSWPTDYSELVTWYHDIISAINNATENGLNEFPLDTAIAKGKAVNWTNGRDITQTKYARTSTLLSRGKNALGIVSDTYEMCLVYYDSTCNITTGAGFLGADSFSDGVHFLTKDCYIYVINFHRKDDAVLEDSDITAIQALLKYYTATDQTLLLSNKPADAKKTGEKIEELKDSFAELALYPSELTLSSDLVTNTITGKYVKDDGGYTTRENFNVKSAPVEGSKIYAVECYSTVGAIHMMCFRDKNNNVVRDLNSLPYNYFSKFGEGTTYLIKAPEKAVKLEITVSLSVNPDATIKEVEKGPIYFIPELFLTRNNFTDELINEIFDEVVNIQYKTIVRKPFVFSGKTPVFAGDSITHGYINGSTSVQQDNGDYPHLFCDAVGMSYVKTGDNKTNIAIGGALFCSGYNQVTTIPDQIKNYAGTYNILFIAGGVNDWQEGATLSELRTTIQNLCDWLNTNKPGIPVIWITPINVASKASDPDEDASLQEFRNVITRTVLEKDTGARFSVIQGTDFNFPNYYDNSDYKAFMFGDGLHPSASGYKQLYTPGLLNALC